MLRIPSGTVKSRMNKAFQSLARRWSLPYARRNAVAPGPTRRPVGAERVFAIDALIPSPTPGLGKCSARGPESITALSVETGAGLDGVLRQGRRAVAGTFVCRVRMRGLKIPDGHGTGVVPALPVPRAG